MDKKFTVIIPEKLIPFLRKGIQEDTIFTCDKDNPDSQCIQDIISMYAILGGLNPDLCQISVEESI